MATKNAINSGIPIEPSKGGTGATTLTDHGVLIGNAANAITATAEGASGKILTGVTGNPPAWTTATYPADVNKGDVLVASADHIIGVEPGAVTAGYILTANGANTAPTFQAASGGGIGTLAGDSGTATGATVNVLGGAGITTSATGSTVTITASAVGLPWDRKTTTPITMVATNGYVQANAGAGLTTFVMPATAALGTVIEIIGESAGGWTITHAVGTTQSIQYGNLATTVTSGSLSSTNRYDCVKLICRVADTTWSVVSAVGVLNVA